MFVFFNQLLWDLMRLHLMISNFVDSLLDYLIWKIKFYSHIMKFALFILNKIFKTCNVVLLLINVDILPKVHLSVICKYTTFNRYLLPVHYKFMMNFYCHFWFWHAKILYLAPLWLSTVMIAITFVWHHIYIGSIVRLFFYILFFA